MPVSPVQPLASFPLGSGCQTRPRPKDAAVAASATPANALCDDEVQANRANQYKQKEVRNRTELRQDPTTRTLSQRVDGGGAAGTTQGITLEHPVSFSDTGFEGARGSRDSSLLSSVKKLFRKG